MGRPKRARDQFNFFFDKCSCGRLIPQWRPKDLPGRRHYVRCFDCGAAMFEAERKTLAAANVEVPC